MRVVHHHDRAMPLGHLDQVRERRDVPVHGEDAVGDQQLPAPGRLRLPEQLVRRPGVLVGEHLDLCP
jgi:hypothetical protein